MEVKRKLTRVRNTPDRRDLKFSSIDAGHFALPAEMDLEPFDVKIRDQKSTSACTGFGIAGHIDFERKQLFPNGVITNTSAFWIYAGERILEGDLNEDAGASIRDGFEVISNLGRVTEKIWPSTQTNLFKKPSPACYKEALTHAGSKYYTIDTVDGLMSCIADKHTAVGGFDVPVAFMDSHMERTGEMSDQDWRGQTDGGHCIDFVGYSTKKQAFKLRNSWSSKWGVKGYFWMPMWYVKENIGNMDITTLRLGPGLQASVKL